jgi:hypothetical protein
VAYLEANTEPVGFDFAAAQRLIAELLNTAQALRATRAARRTMANRALVDWKGTFARQFAADMATGEADAERLAGTFEHAADQVRMLARSAEQEQVRRAQAQKYEEQQRKRSNLQKVEDLVGLGDDDVPPPPLPATPPSVDLGGPRISPVRLDANRK